MNRKFSIGNLVSNNLTSNMVYSISSLGLNIESEDFIDLYCYSSMSMPMLSCWFGAS